MIMPHIKVSLRSIFYEPFYCVDFHLLEIISLFFRRLGDKTVIIDDQCLASFFVDDMHCAIWYHLYNFKNEKSTHGGALLLVKSQALACNFTESNTPPWVFFTFFKLYKLY